MKIYKFRDNVGSSYEVKIADVYWRVRYFNKEVFKEGHGGRWLIAPSENKSRPTVTNRASWLEFLIVTGYTKQSLCEAAHWYRTSEYLGSKIVGSLLQECALERSYRR